MRVEEEVGHLTVEVAGLLVADVAVPPVMDGEVPLAEELREVRLLAGVLRMVEARQ